ncbi:pyridoxal phosphate-dependent aminotransferase [Streptococcus chenjunshii]|uniref:cysteine-S-conjugate beta-lyase n=1 Tax=Streptococcus chenjunshii TaxID=2173853 RepID=A0A372KKU0_9STRE|nr:MalY/PatB family protein [Streptococcus chenjunshii]AXQ79179.1 pyridoxal phosphate-dependent aminotransferase [Streptococcus chenjunshii]RFU50750.1 pyridoxal phosphate-dependent aminotransferase [Streptococcus chenjunshii]RFU52932.1 pyridoxal phosphate-dependent aminotransferase [Streptococcus chenjunshii]
MQRYDFTTRPDRLGQSSVKWQQSENQPDLLQMWVADMDFLPLPAVKKALSEYADQHVFGYTYPSDSLYQSILDWEKKEHGYSAEKEHVVLIEGVVPAISTAIQAYTQEGEAVLINTPVYPPFARSVKLNQRQLITNSLVIRDGRFTIDFEQLEADIIKHKVKLYILCSPHNPGGRVWSKEELTALLEICEKHQVILVSDEIHQDLALFGHKHCSINTIDQRFKDFTLVLASATKTFNIAGTKTSYAIIENEELRRAFKKRQLGNNQHELPAVGLLATEAAFTYGKPWLEELKAVLEENITYVIAVLTENTKIKVMKPEGTYLIWLDFSAYGLQQPEINQKLQDEGRLVLNDGFSFGPEGKTYARLNVAAPLTTVKEACRRIGRVFGN